MTVRILVGDCRERLKELESGSVHCCVSSPPYFGLRDYGVSGQMGLESTPDEFVAGMVEVFREVRRVLRDDGTLWLNIGDSYATGTKADRQQSPNAGVGANRPEAQNSVARIGTPQGCKTKDLIGIPWLLAFALRADGWFLRQEIIWSKPNPMPESVRDRCTKAHEQIFLLSKGPRYYFDAEAIAEPSARIGDVQTFGGAKAREGEIPEGDPRSRGGSETWGRTVTVADTRNKRSVWEVATQPFSEAHFATYPPALIEPCILAGCPKGGIVLDPFFGAGTTGLVADRLGRNCIGIELNPEYAAIAERRLNADSPLFAEVKAA